MLAKEKSAEGRIRKPGLISKITWEQMQELVKKALEMAQQGDFSGISAMAAQERNFREYKDSDHRKK